MTFKFRSIFSFLVISIQLSCSFAVANDLQLHRPEGGDFGITTTDGNLNTKDLRGKFIFLYFGFLNCPHICPMISENLKRFISELGPEERKLVRVLFVTVDNERDSKEKLKEFVRRNGPEFMAGFTDETNLKKSMSLFGARYAKLKTENGSLLIDHTDSIFIINQNGIWANTLNYNASVAELKSAFIEAQKVETISQKYKKNNVVKVLGDVKSCQLENGPCSVMLPDKSKLEVELSPRPVKVLKDFRVIANLKSKKYTVQSVDFKGEIIDMGFIRPDFTKFGMQNVANVNLPICELKEMRWKVNVIFSDKQNNQFSEQFYLETK